MNGDDNTVLVVDWVSQMFWTGTPITRAHLIGFGLPGLAFPTGLAHFVSKPLVALSMFAVAIERCYGLVETSLECIDYSLARTFSIHHLNPTQSPPDPTELSPEQIVRP